MQLLRKCGARTEYCDFLWASGTENNTFQLNPNVAQSEMNEHGWTSRWSFQFRSEVLCESDRI